MNATELLRIATNVAFVGLFVATLMAAVRRPRRERITVAILFALPALSISAGWLRDLTGVTLPSFVTATLVMAIPYVTLRAVADIAEIPRMALRLALAGLAVSVALATALPQGAAARSPIAIGLTAALVLYFFAVEAYAAWATIREARRSRGVTRSRLVAVAAGSLLLGLTLLSVLPILAFPALAPAVQVLALASTVAYYVGFAPPAPLRQLWQSRGLREFLDLVSISARLPNTTAVMAALARGCASVLGSSGGTVGIPMGDGMFRIVTDDGTVYEHPGSETVGALAIEARAPVARPPHPGSAWARGMHAILSAPVLADDDPIAFVSVFARRPSLFLEEDMELLQLLAAQASVVLQNRRLYDELRVAHDELERRLNELNAANAELGAFAYSVSHDLRAPLRSLDGFSHALLERYEERLDETGKRYLGFVRESSQEMGQLIDDLLRLSLVSRSEMSHEEVDLSALSADIVARLRRADSDRAVRVSIEPGLIVDGDLALIRTALENLIGNAWKFTSKRRVAEIAIGRVEQGRDTFFVRDNGAGFDMRYAGKLFGAFQRLHAKSEFPGTGIGLATVQRVVRRHGGDVWASSEVDKGTTFYFTFGPREASRETAEEDGGSVAVPPAPMERMAS